MILKRDNFNLFLIFTFLVSSFIFCIGFFPYSDPKAADGTHFDNFDKLNIPQSIDKGVLMIIDALRIDLIENSLHFPYLHQLLQNGSACFLRLKANLPTVTKPRIKALTSGTVPSFLDVVRNFLKGDIGLDTFLHSMHKRGEKIVFSGDDTWVNMFNFFHRQYANEDSLFVTDFYEGDAKITNSLQYELTQSDWKFLILHFLGLDHMGHVFIEGPFHELVPEKLKEMDNVVKMIHTKLVEWNRQSKQKSLLFLTSDHGMRDSGGHSGNSYAETHIPLLVIGTKCESNNKTFYNQIDFATTFSIMKGLPLPKSSMGSAIPELLFDLELSQKLDVFKVINQRLLKMLAHDKSEEFYLKYEKAKSFHHVFENDKDNKNAYQLALSNYLESSRDISERIAQKSLEVNLFYVVVGLLCNILISIAIIIPTDDTFVRNLKISLSKCVPVILVFLALKIFVFNEIFDLKNDIKSFIIVIILSTLIRLVVDILFLKLERFKIYLFDNDILYLLTLGHTFFTISVGSSSFIEEEHQIWYYFCNSMLVILTFYEFRGRKRVESFVKVTCQCFPILLMHIIVRRLNQTGDKWINVQDIGDWLHKSENEDWLHLSIILSLALTFAWLCLVHIKSKILTAIAFVAHVLLYFHHSRSLVTQRIDLSITTLFWINFAIFIAYDVYTQYKRKTSNYNFFTMLILLSLLLHKPQNLIMCFAIGVTSIMINHSSNRMIKNVHERIVAKVILHWWIGKLFYFYQGNSNSLSTVDTNAGFVGQSHVHLVLVFIFTALVTFNSQLVALSLLVLNLTDDSKRLALESDTIKSVLIKYLAILTIIPNTVFLVIITILRHHLFIWSVFSPKLLYDFCFSVLMFIVSITVKIMIKF